jgi:hypothetical protein
VGIPHLKPLDCDSCAVSIPLSEVDSLQLTPGDRNALAATGTLVGFFLGVMLAWRTAERD